MTGRIEPTPGTAGPDNGKERRGRRPVLPWIKAVLGLVGLGFFIHLLNRVGWGNILDNIRRLGPWFLLVFLVEAARVFLMACGWSTVHNAFFKKIPLATLYRFKIISDNFNFAIPSASLGGDAVRTLMIRKNTSLKEGIPSVLFDKTFEYIGSTAYLMIGFGLGLLTTGLPASFRMSLIAGVAVTAAGLALLVGVQARGITGTVLKLSRLVPKFGKWFESREAHLRETDANSRLLYTRRSSKALVAGSFHLLSRLVGTLEVFFVLRILQAPVSLAQAVLISAVVTAVNTAFFILPGQLGVMESAHILMLKTLGYPPEIGLSLSMIRRIRRLVFVGLALMLFFFSQRKGAE